VDDRTALPVRASTKPGFTRAIGDVARRIEDAWHRVHYDDDSFADIAQRILTEERLHERYDAYDVVREGIAAPLVFPQVDAQAKFGQPPITFFRNARFYISVLFWVDSSTSIHEHGFSGAFCVLGGESLQVGYGYTPSIRVNSRLSVGKLERKSACVLERGDVQRIIAGPQGAHALFHLERPSATLIVRTRMDARAQPQLTYHWPCYAIDPFFDDDAIGRKCQLLALVHETNKDSFQPIATELLASLDLESTVRVLLYLRQLNLGMPQAFELASVAAQKHGELGEGLVQLVEAGHRESQLISLRRRVVDRERRLLLAFLLNRLSPGEVKALVARKYRDDEPADLVATWIASLLEAGGGMASSPLIRRAIRLLLTGQGLQAVNRWLASEFDIIADDDRSAAAALVRTLSDSPLLASLLASPTPSHSPQDEEGSAANNVISVETPSVADSADLSMRSCQAAPCHRTNDSPVLTVEQYLPPAACLALREEYNDGLRRNCFTPRGVTSNDIALSHVTSNDALTRLHLDVAERIRAHFALPPLRVDYCAYTRLWPGGMHSLHSDAVTLDGRPNHTPDRVASAMLYLTDGETDFEGGALRFPKLEIEVTPRIGLLVGFLTNLDYQHEVPPVTAGVRDALAMWFQIAS
jgi:hypothetical protein